MQKFVDGVIRVFDRYMPEPFAFGVLMTLMAMVLTWAATDAQPVQVVVAWGDGLSMLLPFITQVCLTIMFAFALAHLGPVPKYLHRLASLPRSSTMAYAFCALFTGAVCLLCWPLGTILGGLMAKEVALSCRARELPCTIHCWVAPRSVALWSGIWAIPPQRRCWWPQREIPWRRCWADCCR